MRHQLGLFFSDKSDGEVKLAVQLYKSAVQISWHKGKIAVNWDLHHGIAHFKGQIGVVFQGQSSDEVKSAVQLYKSADRKAKLL